MPAGDPYIPIDTLKTRVSYDGEQIFEEHNEEKRFHDLLEQLEDEARGLINTRTGDQTFNYESGRTDTFRATDDAAVPLVYPIRDVTQVEVKNSLASDWRTLDTDEYDFSKHRLILVRPTRGGSPSTLQVQRKNPLLRDSNRMTWRDIATKIRVTYDRGWETIPPDVQSVTVSIVNQLLRQLRNEQNVAQMEPEQIRSLTDASTVLTDDIRNRIDQITKLGGWVQSV